MYRILTIKHIINYYYTIEQRNRILAKVVRERTAFSVTRTQPRATVSSTVSTGWLRQFPVHLD